jgi:hypothetical protein
MAGNRAIGNRRNIRNLWHRSRPEFPGISNWQELRVEAEYLNGGRILVARVDDFIFTIA